MCYKGTLTTQERKLKGYGSKGSKGVKPIKLSHHINVMIDPGQNDENLLNKLKSVSGKNKGQCGLIIHLKSENGMIQRIRASKIGVNASKDFIQNLRDVFGNAHVWIS